MSDRKTRTLPAGTVLFHGTDAFRRFKVPRGPAWFAWSWDEAAKWAGWGSIARSQRRVIEVRLTAPISIQDTELEAHWRKLCDELCADPDATPWQMARAVSGRGLVGWYGRAEVLIVDTAVLQHVRRKSVPDIIVPWGRSTSSYLEESNRTKR